MRILVTTIPFSGMKIDAPIAKDPLNVRLQEGSEEGAVTFTEDPMVDITLTRTHGGVMVKGVVTGTCRQGCSTCGDNVPHGVISTVDWLLQTSSDRAGLDDDLDDPGVIVYEGDHINLEDHLQEALILNLSPFWHPPRDTQDRCTLCKRQCSAKAWSSGEPKESTASDSRPSLGSLLKGALAEKKKR